MYRLLANALAFPAEAFHESVRAGTFRASLLSTVDGLPFVLKGVAAQALGADQPYVEFQGEYIRLFDVGAVRPPCPLYGGEWGRSRRSSMEDALRFYQYFGMKMNEDARELPDHVTVQLEFMQVMAHTEAVTRASKVDPLPVVRAERDFLSRHLARWWPLLRKKIVMQSPSPFYDGLTATTDIFLAADLGWLRELADAGRS
jgi:DMSO reductase family type II enzyme chaperone